MIEQQQSYRFKLVNPHLNQSLVKVDFKIKKENCQANFKFIENVNGSVFNLIEDFIKNRFIELVVLDGNLNETYKISLYGIKTTESEINFSYDYTMVKPVSYDVVIKFINLVQK